MKLNSGSFVNFGKFPCQIIADPSGFGSGSTTPVVSKLINSIRKAHGNVLQIQSLTIVHAERFFLGFLKFIFQFKALSSLQIQIHVGIGTRMRIWICNSRPCIVERNFRDRKVDENNCQIKTHLTGFRRIRQAHDTGAQHQPSQGQQGGHYPPLLESLLIQN